MRVVFAGRLCYNKVKLLCAAISTAYRANLNSQGNESMWFWWFMLCCDLSIPFCMIVFGWLMWKHPPQKINGLMGYRTSRSMKNMDTWKFAHEYSGRLWWKIGWILILPSAVVHIPVYGASDNAISIAGGVLVTVQIVILIASIFPTENALKRTFREDGTRRNL